MTISEIRKAIAATVVPVIVVLGASLLPDSDAGTAISLQEGLAIAVAGLSCGAVVYSVPNARKRRTAE